MSNRRRKNIGNKKIARNHLMRVVRGAHKMGNPLPGRGVHAVSAMAEKVRDQVDELVMPYWRGH
jgi:hypothetical protein